MELRNVLNEIDKNAELTENEKGFAHFAFAERSGDYFLEIASKMLKKDVKFLLTIAMRNDTINV
jgi:hypothetical protein